MPGKVDAALLQGKRLRRNAHGLFDAHLNIQPRVQSLQPPQNALQQFIFKYRTRNAQLSLERSPILEIETTTQIPFLLLKLPLLILLRVPLLSIHSLKLTSIVCGLHCGIQSSKLPTKVYPRMSDISFITAHCLPPPQVHLQIL